MRALARLTVAALIASAPLLAVSPARAADAPAMSPTGAGGFPAISAAGAGGFPAMSPTGAGGFPAISAARKAGESLTAAEEPVVVVAADFEDGTTQGWAGRAAETVTAGNAVAHAGSGSLAVSGRTATWQGPSLDVLTTFEKGTSYSIRAWVRMAGGSDSARLSVERRLEGVTAYDQVVGSTAVTSAGWVELEGRYTLADDADFLRLYVETASTTGDLFVDDVTVSYVPPLPIQTDIPSIKDVITEFPVGAAVTGAETLGGHGQLLAKHFDSITPGNALKWDATEPGENTFTYAQADPLVAFAKAHGMAIRGHTLVWHNQTPAWVFAGADKALLLARLENHIRNVAGHYGDDIGVWDVVNEVIDENQPDGMRHSQWYTVTGLDYIRTAFRVAHEVAPHAKLFINDYNTNVPAKRDALYDLVAKLKAEGVPIDGVGHQMHINVSWPSVADTEAMLRKFQPLGVEQQITEMDVSIYTGDDESFPAPPADRLRQQAYVYRDMFALFRRYAADITSVTLWGLADDNTWLDTFPVTRKDAPLLFDTRLQAKSAYRGVADPGELEIPADDGCAATYRVTGSWPGGFQGYLTIANTGNTAISSWKVSWTYTGGQAISRLWNGTMIQSGSTVTVTNAAWNGTLAPGASASAGFLAGVTGSNPAPATITCEVR